MKRSNWFWLVIEGFIWYVFIYSYLYFIKNPVSLFWASITLTLIIFAIFLTSPVFRNMKAINKMLDRILEEEEKKLNDI